MNNRLSSVAAYLVPYLGLILLVILPPMLVPTSGDAAGEVISTAVAENPEGPWQPDDLQALVLPDDYGWLKVVFTVPSDWVSGDAQPLGLFLSGTFSATAIWNGKTVGSKGQPGKSRASESPGPVDTIIYLPEGTTLPGNNTLLLEISSHYRQHSLSTIIHGGNNLSGLRLAPYSSDVRRPLGYYAAPLLMSVLLLIAFFVLLFRPERSLQPLLLVASLGVAAMAEIFRSFVAYPYAYHGLRLWLLSAALVVFANVLVFHLAAQLRFPTPKPRYLAISTGLWLAAVTWPGPPEDVAGWALITALLCGLGLSAKAVWDKRPGAIPHLLAVLCLLLFFFPGSRIFLDRNLYAAAIPLIALLFWPSRREDATLSQPATAPLARLVVQAAGVQKSIAYERIVAINGAGNYAEIVLNDGSKVLDDRGLTTLENKLPATFCRVHRSHIVNLEHVRTVRSLGAGKYAVDMKGGERCSVSRSRVRQLRELLAAAGEAGVAVKAT